MLSAVVIFVVTCLSVTVADTVCPLGWSPFQGSCYLVGQESASFSLADRECSSKKGMLAEITSEKENEFVKDLLNTTIPNDGETKAYIGVFLKSDSNNRDWVSYSDYDEQSFFDWVNPDWEPHVDFYSDDYYYWDGYTYYSRDDEYCASMSKEENWSWAVVECYEKQNYVCERKPLPCYQGSCYQLLSGTYEFPFIQDKCKNVSGNVLEINSQGEEDTVITYLRGQCIDSSYTFDTRHVWLGATDDGSETEFRWLSTQEKIDYSHWSDKEPNNSGANGVAENCVVLDNFRDDTWNDVVCDGDHAVVCEIESTSGITG